MPICPLPPHVHSLPTISTPTGGNLGQMVNLHGLVITTQSTEFTWVHARWRAFSGFAHTCGHGSIIAASDNRSRPSGLAGCHEWCSSEHPCRSLCGCVLLRTGGLTLPAGWEPGKLNGSVFCSFPGTCSVLTEWRPSSRPECVSSTTTTSALWSCPSAATRSQVRC